MSPSATGVQESTAGGVTRLTYRLLENGVKTVTAIVISDAGQIQAAVYFDDETDAATALQIAGSVATC